MGPAGDSADALESARRTLAARDADLAEADRSLIATVAEVHALAADSIRRLEAIASGVEAAAHDQPKDTPGAAREIGRHLLAGNREAADLIREAEDAAHAKTVVLKQLSERYLPSAPS